MNGQAIEKAQGKGRDLKSFLESPAVRAKLAEVASKVMKAEDLIRMALMAVSRNPDIAKCSQASIVRSLLDAAELGIQPGGAMGRGYLIPRKNKHNGQLECCFDPGWRGLIDVARRSGQIARIESHVVYEKDKFRVVYGVESKIEHEPVLSGARGKIVAAYAVAFFKDDTYQAEVLLEEDINKIRASSASKNGPWAQWYDEMARKSAVRRLAKYLPFDPLLEKALEKATEVDIEADGEAVLDEPVISQPKAQALADKIRARAGGGAKVPSDDELRELEEALAEGGGEFDGPEPAASSPREPGEEG